jgi:predicted SprT family Zn-dependent metalloprotease
MPLAPVVRIRKAFARTARALNGPWADHGYDSNAWADVCVVLTARFTRRLGSADPVARRIRLRSDAPEWSPKLLREVLVHELAHLVVHAQYGPVKAHGVEWQGLMRAACMPAAAMRVGPCDQQPTRLAGERPGPAKWGQRRRLLYAHRCPVCQMVRFARRPVPTWRCRACVEAGLEGLLEVTKAEPIDDDHA